MRRHKLLIAAIACTVVAAAGCSSSGSNSPTAVGASGSSGAGGAADALPKPVSPAQLVAQSHTEHQLIIYGNAPAPYLKPVIDAFSKLYPWINVQDSDMSDNQTFSKYQSEHAQGAR